MIELRLIVVVVVVVVVVIIIIICVRGFATLSLALYSSTYFEDVCLSVADIHYQSIYLLKILFSGYGLDTGNKAKKFLDWKLCAELAITLNCSAVSRQNIFNNANYEYWRVSWK